jgi:hypothetical protein
MSQQEYNSMSNEMRILLLSNRIIIEVACTYKEGEISQKINTLRDNMMKAARIFWNADQATWTNSHAEIMKTFEENIDPMRASVTEDFFNSLEEPSIFQLCQFKKQKKQRTVS